MEEDSVKNKLTEQQLKIVNDLLCLTVLSTPVKVNTNIQSESIFSRLVEGLIGLGADIHYKNEMPIRLALDKKLFGLAERFIQVGADVNPSFDGKPESFIFDRKALNNPTCYIEHLIANGLMDNLYSYKKGQKSLTADAQEKIKFILTQKPSLDNILLTLRSFLHFVDDPDKMEESLKSLGLVDALEKFVLTLRAPDDLPRRPQPRM